MGKEIVNYSCGHSGVVDIYGAVNDRARKAAYYGQGLCPECLAAERAARAAADAAAATAQGLPALTGSPKQVAWAESLRAAAIAAAKKQLAAARKQAAAMIRRARNDYRAGRIAVRPTLAALAAWQGDASYPATAPARTLAQLMGETSAKWFIDHR